MENFEQKHRIRFIGKFLILLYNLYIYFLLVHKYFGFSYLNFLFKFFILHQSTIKKFNDNKIHIFTFWEPSSKLPGYLQLCLTTWKKNIPNYKIIILDYSKLHKYLNSSIISKILCKKMTLSIQSDAIRVAILEKYGGIWMDIDTIITNYRFLKNVFGYDLAFFGYPKEKKPATGFIYASKNSRIVKEWLIKIIKRVSFFKKLYSKKNKISDKLAKIYHWDYLANGIIDQLLKKANKKEFIIFDWVKTNAIPECTSRIIVGKKNINKIEVYRKFYFYPGNPHKILYKNPGIIFLHNSWIEKKYKYMSNIEFLEQNIMLSSLLKKLQ